MIDKLKAADELRHAAQCLCDAIMRNGEWDDGCFYYCGTSASSLQGPLTILQDALAKPAKSAQTEPSPKYAHQPCDECDPSFVDCWTARSLCRKKPVPQPAESQAAGDWKSCGEISCDECNERYAAAQARIASLTGELDACEQHVIIKQHRIDELRDENNSLAFQLSSLKHAHDDHEKDYLAVWKLIKQPNESVVDSVKRVVARVAVLEKALEGARDALKKAGKSGWLEYGNRTVTACPICNTPRSLDGVIEHESECSIRVAVSDINAALAAQPSRTEETK